MSGLLQATFDGVETAFAVAYEWVRIASYRKKTGNPTYDPITDTMSDQGTVIENVRVIQTAASLEEREASPVAINDAKFIVPSVDLPGVEPGENDVLTLDGVDWNVLVDKYVPGRPIHILFARKA
jgi:hypothetical protein